MATKYVKRLTAVYIKLLGIAMKHMKILITGASGSGTSTLGKAISSTLNCSWIEADDYYWHLTTPPYTKKRDHPSRLRLIIDKQSVQKSTVISGSIMNWGLELENSFDLIIFLYLDSTIRVQRLRIREQKVLGSVDEDFMQWASEYDAGPSEGRSLAKHSKWLSERSCKVLKIEGDLTVQQRSDLALDALTQIN